MHNLVLIYVMFLDSLLSMLILCNQLNNLFEDVRLRKIVWTLLPVGSAIVGKVIAQRAEVECISVRSFTFEIFY